MSAVELVTHLSAIDVVQDEVQFVRCLERIVQAHQERVLDILQQHIPL